MRKLCKSIVVALFIFLAAGPASGQEFWEKKAYTEWNKEQCRKVLQDSPWSRTFTVSNIREDQFGQPTEGESRATTEQKVNYFVQLRGALPVRQAVIRSAMIQNKYENLSADIKKNFDASAERYLNGSSQFLIVHVEYETNVQFFDRALAELWQSFPEGTMPAYVYLTTSKGKRVAPVNWKFERGGGRAFEFYFPREMNGEPVISEDDKSFLVEFPNPTIRELRDPKAVVEFKLAKMKYKGEVIF